MCHLTVELSFLKLKIVILKWFSRAAKCAFVAVKRFVMAVIEFVWSAQD